MKTQVRFLRHRLALLLSRLRGRRFLTLEEANFRNLYLDAVWVGILSGAVGTFTSVFAVRLGAPNLFLGLMATGPALVTILLSMPAARLVERFSERRVRIVILGRLIHRLGYIFIALMPFFIGPYGPHAIVAIVAMRTIPSAAMSVAFTHTLADVIPPEKRSNVMSLRYALMGAVSTITVFISGKVLDLERLPFPRNYQILFLTTTTLSMIGLYYFNRIQVPYTATPAPEISPKGDLLPRLRSAARTLASARAFLNFTLATFVFQWGLSMTHPLFSIYWVKNLEASDSWIGLFATSSGITAVISYFLWGKIASRRGDRLVLSICAFGISLYPILTGLSRSVERILVISVLSGIVSAGFHIAIFNLRLKAVPEEKRPTYLALHNISASAAALAAPILGTSLSDILGITVALFCGGGVRVLGALLLHLLPLEREATTGQGTETT